MTKQISSTPRECISRRAFLSLFTDPAVSPFPESAASTPALVAAGPSTPQYGSTQTAAPVPTPVGHSPPVSPAVARRLAYFRIVVTATGKHDP